MRIHFAVALATLMLARWLQLGRSEIIPLWLAIGLVICIEAVNTAVETVVDLASQEVHPLARLAKDVAAGAVLWSVVIALGIGLWIFGPHLGRLPQVVAQQWYAQPMAVLLPVLLVAVLLVSGLRR